MPMKNNSEKSVLADLIETETLSTAMREAFLMLVHQDAMQQKLDSLDRLFQANQKETRQQLAHLEAMVKVDRGLIDNLSAETTLLSGRLPEFKPDDYISQSVFEAELDGLKQRMGEVHDQLAEMQDEIPTKIVDDTQPTLIPEKPFIEPLTGMAFEWILAQAGGAGFLAGKYQVTQGEWELVMGVNPSMNKAGERYPVEMVSWNDAQEFVQKLIDYHKGKIKFALPCVTQWIASSGVRQVGGHFNYYTGTGLTREDAHFDGHTTKPVGSYKPNQYGLYDIHGNVREMCATTDKKAIYLKGGSFQSVVHDCSVYTSVLVNDFTIRDSNTGLRLVINC